jgi:hypothetical protein
MTLYELRAYRTSCYDASSESNIRLRDTAVCPSRVQAWIAGFLSKCHDGRVTVWEVVKKRRPYRGGKLRKVFTEDANGRLYYGVLAR